MYKLCKEVLGVDTLVIATHPMVQDFYRCILLFEPIDNYKVHKYEFVQGAEAVGQFLRINGKAEAEWERTYDHLPDKRNLFKYFLKTDLKNFQLNTQSSNRMGDIVFSPALLQYFFSHQTDVIESLSTRERQTLSNLYFYGPYRSVIGVKPTETHSARNFARFSVLCHCAISDRASGKPHVATGLEASRRGLKLRLKNAHKYQVGQDVEIAVQLSPELTATVKGRVIWELSDLKQIGIILSDPISTEWHAFIDHMERQLLSHLEPPTPMVAEKKPA